MNSKIYKRVRSRKIRYFYKIANQDKDIILNGIKTSHEYMTCDKGSGMVSLGFMSPDGVFYDLRVLQMKRFYSVDNLSDQTINRFFVSDFGHDSFAIEFFRELLPKELIMSGVKFSDGSFKLFSKKDLFKKAGWIFLHTTKDIGVPPSWYRLLTEKVDSVDISDSEKNGLESLILYANRCSGNSSSFNIYDIESGKNKVRSLISFSANEEGFADNLLYTNKVFNESQVERLESILYV